MTIGSRTSIGSGTTVARSILGQSCQIGNNVSIDNSCLFDCAAIEDGCKITSAVICANAVIKAGVSISKGCIIGPGVVIGIGAKIPDFTHVCLLPDENEDLESLEVFLGKDSRGYAYSSVLEDCEIDIRNANAGRIGASYSITHLADGFDSPSGPETSDPDDFPDSESDDGKFRLTVDWEQEVQQTITRALEEKHDVDIAALELNTLKMALDLSFQDLVCVVFPSILDLLDPKLGTKSINLVFEEWSLLLEKFIHSDSDQFALMGVLTVVYTNTVILRCKQALQGNIPAGSQEAV